MNKKYKYKSLIFLPLIAVFTFAGCTLMMEGDEELAPEEQGFDEPVTEENEYGKITYQYQDGVKPVTENVLEYIVESDDPNVIYFMDNIPNEWVPKVGEYLAGGCNPKIPEGLCNKVLGITHENGMYKIELGPATEDEVYKELEIELDFDHELPDMDEVPNITEDMTDEEKAKAVYDDWSLFGTDEEIKERYGVKSVGRNKIKKASDVVNEDKEETRNIFEFKIDTRPGNIQKNNNSWKNLILSKMSDWAKKFGIQCTPYFGLSYSQTNHMHYHTYHNKSAKKDEIWTEITPTYDFYLEVGIEIQGKKLPFTNNAGHFADTKLLYNYFLSDLMKKNIRSSVNPVVGFQRDQKGAIRIAIPAQPSVRIVIEPSIEPILTLGGCVGGHLKTTGDTWRQGTLQEGKDKKEIKKFIKSGNIQVNEWFVHGYIKAGVDARLGIGAEIARTVTVTVGAGAEVAVEVGAESTTSGEADPFLIGVDTRDYFSCPLYIRFGAKGYIDLKVVVSALGIFDLWSEKATLGTFNIARSEKSINQDIRIGSAPGYLITPVVLTDENDQYIQYHFEYDVKSTGNSSVYTGKFIPRVKVYDKDKKYLFDIEANGFEDHNARTLENKTYTFDAKRVIHKRDIDYDISKYEVYFVPYLYRYSDQCYLYSSLATKVKSTTPMLTCNGVTQTYGGPMKKDRAKTYNLKTNEYDYEDERMCYIDFYEYRFNVDLKVENGSLMEYIGLYVKIIQSNGITDKVLFAKTIKKKNPKTGKYTYDIAFAIDKKTAEEKLNLIYADIEIQMKSILDKDNNLADSFNEKVIFKNGVDNNPGKSSYGSVESTTL